MLARTVRRGAFPQIPLWPSVIYRHLPEFLSGASSRTTPSVRDVADVGLCAGFARANSRAEQWESRAAMALPYPDGLSASTRGLIFGGSQAMSDAEFVLPGSRSVPGLMLRRQRAGRRLNTRTGLEERQVPDTIARAEPTSVSDRLGRILRRLRGPALIPWVLAVVLLRPSGPSRGRSARNRNNKAPSGGVREGECR